MPGKPSSNAAPYLINNTAVGKRRGKSLANMSKATQQRTKNSSTPTVDSKNNQTPRFQKTGAIFV